MSTSTTTPFPKILIIGATSGIGEALADRFVKEGSYVIVTGRRQEKLDEFVAKHGGKNGKEKKCEGIKFDVTDIGAVDGFVERITKTHPDLSTIFLNSGIQRTMDFTNPSSINLDTARLEFETNYFSYLALTKSFLPFFLGKSKEEQARSALIYTSSSLALVPNLRCANYCASKAAMHMHCLSLRAQLEAKDIPLRIIELFPPSVQTELHAPKHQPELGPDGESIGMPLADFTDAAYKGIVEQSHRGESGAKRDGDGNENGDVPVETAKEWYDAFEPRRRKVFEGIVKG